MTASNAPLTAILYNGAQAAATESFVGLFDFGPIRIKRFWAISDQAQAASASVLREFKVGTPADNDRYCHLTNNSGLTSSLANDADGVIVSSAWAAKTTKELDFAAKTVGNKPKDAAPATPGGSFPEHSGVLEVTAIHSGTTPTACRSVLGMEYFKSE